MRTLYLWFAAIAIVTYLGSIFIHAAHSDAVPGTVIVSAPEWVLKVFITKPDTEEAVDTLTLTDAPNHARRFASKDECVAFQTTDEFKATLPALARFLADQGWNNDRVGMACEVVLEAQSF